jgi:hypothetical protein
MPTENTDARGVPMDQRLLGKPVSNADGFLPIMEYDFRKLELTSQNIWQAQMAGWCRILTYDYVAEKAALRQNRSKKRYESLTKAGVVYRPDTTWR